MLMPETIQRHKLPVMGYNPVYCAAGAGWKRTGTVQGLPALRSWGLSPCNSWEVASVVPRDLTCAAKLQLPAQSECLPSSVEDLVPSQPEVALVERVAGVGGRTD